MKEKKYIAKHAIFITIKNTGCTIIYVNAKSDENEYENVLNFLIVKLKSK